MKCSEIDFEIDRLDLKWQEYDFGDIMYAKIPVELLFSKTSIFENCETQKYRVQFTVNDYVLVFSEPQKPLFVNKIESVLSRIYLLFRKKISFKAFR